MTHRTLLLVPLLLAVAAATAAPATAASEANRDAPPDFTPKLGANVPTDRPFTDERGRNVKLSDFFHPEKPVVLIFAYYRCPKLCSIVLQAAADGLKGLTMSAGNEFEVVVISMDPTETPELSKLNHQAFLARYARPGAARGVHFLTGKERDIRAVADAVGFNYWWNEDLKQYVHPAGLFLLTPGGKVSQCITGVYFEPKTLRYSILDASEGKQGSILDKVLLWCHTFDPESGEYTLAAWNLTRVVGVLTMLGLAVFLVPMWVRGRRRRHDHENES